MKKAFGIFILLICLLSGKFVFAADVLATVDDKNFTEAEVLKVANMRMMKLLSQMYEVKRATVEQMIDEYLLDREAKKKGKSVDVLQKEIIGKAGTPTEAEAKVIYEMNKQRYKDKTFDDVKPQLLKQLERQKQQVAVSEYFQKLRKAAKIKINLERPRMEVSVDDDPGNGNKNAPVVLIEFSDFQCPFCKRVRPTISRLMKEYDGKLYYVFRDFPLNFHQQAKYASNAANCANEQGKYWEYNEKMWNEQAQISKKDVSQKDMNVFYVSVAKELSLDEKAFSACIESKKYFSEIDKDQQEGMEVGVTGTPAYFINGMFLSGAQPYENFKQIIDEELDKLSEK